MNEVFECVVCLTEYDWGHMHDRHVCAFCNRKKEVYTNGHPVTGQPKKFCKCGLPWNSCCAMHALFGMREVNPEHAFKK